jgi:hypothetical protein
MADEPIKKSDVLPMDSLAVIAIAIALCLFIGYYAFISLAPLIIYGIVGVIILFITGMIIGAVAGMIIFNPSMNIRIMNTLFKERNYHMIKIIRSGHRVNTFIRRVERKPSVEVGKGAYTIDSNFTHMEDQIPTYYFDERDTLPKNLDANDKTIERNRDPLILTNLILKERDLARLDAAQYKKALMMLLYVLIFITGLTLLASALSYFQIGDVAKNVVLTGQQIANATITAAGNVVK